MQDRGHALSAHEFEGADPEAVYYEEPKGHSSPATLIAALIIAAAVLGAAWMGGHPAAQHFDQPYQAVLLSNNQVYYGRLEGYGTRTPVLRDVYYVQTSVNPQTHEQNNILVKRGTEWHGPDRMYLNPNQILLVEPVGPGSRVAALIKSLNKQP
jgi:hypothetical protein